MITEQANEIIISAPKLDPFTPLGQLFCPICGEGPVPLFTRLWLRFLGRGVCVYRVSHCRGGRPPVEEVNGMMEMIMGGGTEKRPLCGGILEPHLHLKCNSCDHIRLMRTKS